MAIFPLSSVTVPEVFAKVDSAHVSFSFLCYLSCVKFSVMLSWPYEGLVCFPRTVWQCLCPRENPFPNFSFYYCWIFLLLGSVYKPLPDSLDYTVDWFKSGAGVPDPHSGILPSLVTVDVTNFLSAPGKLLLGILRSNNGEVHGNVAEKWTSHPFTFFRDYSKGPSPVT